MNRPVESDYTSHVAYARALEYYCNQLEQQVETPPQLPWEGLTESELKQIAGNDQYSDLLRSVAITVEIVLSMKNAGKGLELCP